MSSALQGPLLDGPRRRAATTYWLHLRGDLRRCGLPARGPGGRLRALSTRRGWVGTLDRAVARAARRSPDPALKDLARSLCADWPTHLAGLGAPPTPTLLALERRSTRLVFVFDDHHPEPVLLAKLPGPVNEHGAAEATAALAAEQQVLVNLPGDVVAPRPRGRVGPAWLQDALPGRPLVPRVLRPHDAGTATWPDSMERATALLTRLAAGTATETESRAPHELSVPAALLPVSRGCHERVDSALSRVAGLPMTVLRHGDTSPQNVLVDASGRVGLVDWEGARRGLPGFDTLNLVQALLEQGLALLTWDERQVSGAFEAAWGGSELMHRGREAARLAARAAGVPDALHDDLEVAFYARRLSRRLTGRPDDYAVGPGLAAGMLEMVCAR